MDELALIINDMISVASGFQNSGFFSVLKFIFGIYGVVLLIDVFLLLVQRGLSGDIRETVLGLDFPPELITKKHVLIKKWKNITDKMKSDNESKWKVAIIEADNLVDDLIVRMKYKGENMTERLASINPGQIGNIQELKMAHEIRNRIIHDENFKLSREKAEEVIGWYENFLKYFQVL